MKAHQYLLGVMAIEETHDGAVADLYRLYDMQQQFRSIAGYQEAAAGQGSVIDIPGEIHG